jgi:3',5'-cyclic AMP phosphodiesterase CpdA
MAAAPRWHYRDWLSKRATGWFNLRFLGRGHYFRDADRVLATLAAELRTRRPDHVIFSGDASALGFEEEFAAASHLLNVAGPDTLPGLAVPGNHDYYTGFVAGSGLLERYFAPWQQGIRVDEACYPFAQRVGPIWLIAVNTCTANRLPWDAAGSAGAEQLTRLQLLLKRLEPGLRILVTHYPVCMASGLPEPSYHCLRDVGSLVAIAEQGGVALWLHGHRHGPYHLARTRQASFPIVCAGSATQHGLWSYGEYTIEGRRFHGVRRVYTPERNAFEEHEAFDLTLASSPE